MRYALLASALLAAGGAAVLACSSHAPAQPSAEASFADRFCAFFQPCCGDGGAPTGGGGCQAWLTEQANGATFDPAAANDCLSAMQQDQSGSDFCTDLGAAAGTACAQVYTLPYGNVPPGGACQRDIDCAPGPGGSATCFATDAADGGVAFICSQTSHGQVGDGPCLEGIGNGATSSSWGADAAIPAQSFICYQGDGVYCDFTSHTCAALPGPGGPCTDTNECAVGATCDSSAGTCVALLATGAPCTSDAQCEGSCSAGQCLSGAQQTLCGP